MSSAITRALNEIIEFRIPEEILKLAFLPKVTSARDRVTVSLSEAILRKVIRPKVIVDTSLHGGKVISVDLNGVPFKQIDSNTVLFEIPREKTNYMTIMNVLSVSYVPSQLTSAGYAYPNSYMGSYQNNGSMLNIGTRIATALNDQAFPSTAEAEVLDNNQVILRDPRYLTGAYVLRCMVSNDNAMSNLSPRAYEVFTELCELAVKMKIYRDLNIRIDRTALENGMDFPAIKEKVESYADAATMYQETLKLWTRVTKMTDRNAHQQMIRMQISPGL